MKKVLVGGCFDLLHFGHISFLKNARALGDHLIVALESDENVRHMKGASRPIHSQEQRNQMLEALSCVSEVIMLPPMKSDADYAALVSKVHPNIIAITEGDAVENKKRTHAKSVGANFVVIPKIHTLSTSQLAKLLELE
ncbi:MAG: adenylyltransferase/cytidyltransferase family protein [Patescibacteria group bacterium]